METDEMIFKNECYDIIGACMEVHRELGPGFLEPVYQEALEIEFGIQDIPNEREKFLEIFYKKRRLEKEYVADFICFDEIIIELKAVEEIIPKHISQVLNYLKATGFKLGLLINFAGESLTWKRIIR
jgi:GxxExxY protein